MLPALTRNASRGSPNFWKSASFFQLGWAITATENPIYSEIIITDSGCGISKDDLTHIFERFYKGDKSNDKSFGIGLALARMIITNQNGTVKAENRKEKGAKFTIRFYKVTV